MKAGRPGAYEYELHGLLEREFRHGGGRGWGYYPIVAAGENATVLHYNDNRVQIRDGDLVLIDAGAEHDLYSADVTRTFPASGRFNDAQRACTSSCSTRPRRHLRHPPGREHRRAPRKGGAHPHRRDGGARAAGGNVDELIKENTYSRFYMHRTSHWLGLDVHDAGSYTLDGKPRPLEPGMVFTIEPGLYVPPTTSARRPTCAASASASRTTSW